ncbi:MAG: hypothetical protein A2X12_07585 [Bacteroidetes bacterium GWE2_29_8]|nr:MAG: hypothetical protein A2X12_07585 [Bacteroidetes bacterium GWE2_29_8]OFY22742.1 MAG: hypothetical protein A2X02_02200 [Bacteroidetes bacterium GWF2_29_10]
MLQRKTKIYFLFISFLLLFISSDAQVVSGKGWNFAVNMGYYFPDKYNANFYNGSGRNSIDNVINQNSVSYNPDDVYYNNNYQTLKEDVFGGYDFEVAELPQNMRYNNVMSYGFNIRYFLSEYISLFGDFNVSKLKTVDVFTIDVLKNRSISYINLDNIYQATIAGEEDRMNFNIGLQMLLGNERVRPFIEGGINLNNVKVKKNQIDIGGYVFDIFNPEDKYYNIQQGGIGTGIFAGGGLKLFFANSYSIDFGMNFFMSQFKLLEPYKYQSEKIIFLRLGIDLKRKKAEETPEETVE